MQVCKFKSMLVLQVCRYARVEVSKYASVQVTGPAQGPEEGGSGQGRLNISSTQSAVDIHNLKFNSTCCELLRPVLKVCLLTLLVCLLFIGAFAFLLHLFVHRMVYMVVCSDL